MDKLGEQKVLESSFFELSRNLKSKIFPPVSTMVLPLRNTHYKPLVLRLESIESNNNNINKDKNGNIKNKDKHNSYNEIINDTN